MNIKGITNNGKFYSLPDQKKKQGVVNDPDKKADKLEISTEARVMNNSVKNISEVQSRIDSNFYNSDEVLSVTVDAILKEFGIE